MIADIFSSIEGVAGDYLSRGYPDAPDPDVYIEKIEEEVNRYKSLRGEPVEVKET